MASIRVRSLPIHYRHEEINLYVSQPEGADGMIYSLVVSRIGVAASKRFPLRGQRERWVTLPRKFAYALWLSAGKPRFQ